MDNFELKKKQKITRAKKEQENQEQQETTFQPKLVSKMHIRGNSAIDLKPRKTK